MKLRLWVLFACVVVLFSCKKEVAISDNIIGTWELRSNTNGFTGRSTIYPAGNGATIRYSAYEYVIDSMGKEMQRGTYKIVKDSAQIISASTDRIVYDNDASATKIFITLSGNILTFDYDAYDGPSSVYAKQTIDSK